MNQEFFDLVYLLILLTGIVTLTENRIRRVIFLTGVQGFLLVFPVFQIHHWKDYHAWLLVIMVLVFKTFLTPYAMLWSVKKKNLTEHTNPRFGYLITIFLFLMGLGAALSIVDSIGKLPETADRIEIIYVLMLIYLGIMGFIVRRNWLALMASFTIFENGIFILTLLLQEGLPLGIEFGAFMDALLVVISATVLQIRAETVKGEEE